MSGIVERLRRFEPVYNGCAVPCGEEPVNPDGPDAADAITDLLAALERARGSVKCAISHQDIDTMGRRIDESVLAQIDAAIAKAMQP